MLKRLFIILLFSSVFYSQFVLAEKFYQGWEGEWGEWKKNAKGDYEGQSISIFDCTENNPPQQCTIRFMTVRENTGKYSIDGYLEFISPTQAKVDYSEFSSPEKPIHLNLENTPSSHRIVAKLDTYSDWWPKRLSTSYDFHTDHIYPDSKVPLEAPLYKIACYMDNDPGIKIWCNSPEIPSLITQAYNTALQNGDMIYASAKLDDWLDATLKICRYQKDFFACYKNELAKFENQAQKIAKDQLDRYAKLQKSGDPTKASSIIDKIDGVYKTSHVYHPMDGSESERLENILEIVKTAPNSIYFRLLTDYGNAHGCDISGIASYTDKDDFLFNDHAKNDSDRTCLLKIIPSIKGITLKEVDDDRACEAYCSAIEGSPDEFFGADRRRTIRYMTRLKDSEEYKTAVSGKKDQG